MLGEGGLSLATSLWLLLGFSALYPQGQEGPFRDVQGMQTSVSWRLSQKLLSGGLCSCTAPSPNRAKAPHPVGAESPEPR